MMENQMTVKTRQVEQLETQAEHLQRTVPEKMGPIKEKKQAVEERFAQIKAPLLQRQQQLLKKKEAFQFRRDVEDEKLWIAEKMPQATSSEYGNSLFNVHMLKKKNQVKRSPLQIFHLFSEDWTKLNHIEDRSASIFIRLAELPTGT